MIAGSQIERKTYMWAEKKINIYIKMFIYLKTVLAEIANSGPAQIKWAKEVVWEEKRRKATRFCDVQKKKSMKNSGDIGMP